MTLSGQGQPEALKGARVSANFLEILGIPPLLGRSFLPEEDAVNGPPVVMISASLWKRRFKRRHVCRRQNRNAGRAGLHDRRRADARL